MPLIIVFFPFNFDKKMKQQYLYAHLHKSTQSISKVIHFVQLCTFPKQTHICFLSLSILTFVLVKRKQKTFFCAVLDINRLEMLANRSFTKFALPFKQHSNKLRFYLIIMWSSKDFSPPPPPPPPGPVQVLQQTTPGVDFNLAKAELISHLGKRSDLYCFMGTHAINPLPVLVSESHIKQLANLQESLQFAVQAIVNNFFKDERISRAIELKKKEQSILELYRDKPYDNIGFYRFASLNSSLQLKLQVMLICYFINFGLIRPDILYEETSGMPKLCEINARFTSNGYLLTQFGSEALDRCSLMKDHIKPSNRSIQTIKVHERILSCYEENFDLSKNIGILLGKEVS